MITQETVVEKILTHLNGQLSERDMVHWAEDAYVDLVESDGEISNEQAVLDALMYIAAGDSSGFPLTWEVLSGFLEQLGTRVKVTPEPTDAH